VLKGGDETRSPGRSLNLNYFKKGNLCWQILRTNLHHEWYKSGATTTPPSIQGPLPMHVANIRAPRVTRRCMIYVTGSSGSGKSIQGPGFLRLVHEGERSGTNSRTEATTKITSSVSLFYFIFYFWLSQKPPHLTPTTDIAKEERAVCCICLCLSHHSRLCALCTVCWQKWQQTVGQPSYRIAQCSGLEPPSCPPLFSSTSFVPPRSGLIPAPFFYPSIPPSARL